MKVAAAVDESPISVAWFVQFILQNDEYIVCVWLFTLTSIDAWTTRTENYAMISNIDWCQCKESRADNVFIVLQDKLDESRKRYWRFSLTVAATFTHWHRDSEESRRFPVKDRASTKGHGCSIWHFRLCQIRSLITYARILKPCRNAHWLRLFYHETPDGMLRHMETERLSETTIAALMYVQTVRQQIVTCCMSRVNDLTA